MCASTTSHGQENLELSLCTLSAYKVVGMGLGWMWLKALWKACTLWKHPERIHWSSGCSLECLDFWVAFDSLGFSLRQWNVTTQWSKTPIHPILKSQSQLHCFCTACAGYRLEWNYVGGARGSYTPSFTKEKAVKYRQLSKVFSTCFNCWNNILNNDAF